MLKKLCWIPFLVGCHAKHEATSGPEFFGKFRAALIAKDVDTIWKMSSQEVRTSFVQMAKSEIQISKSREEMNERLEEPLPVPEIPTEDPEAYARILVARWIDSNRSLVDQMTLVETLKTATPFGELTAIVVRYPGVDREPLTLMEVDGYLRLFSTGRLFQLFSIPAAPAATEEE